MAIGDVVSTLFNNSPAVPQQPLPTLTPESIKRRRLLAEAMLKEGMDTSPIKSPWQGAARMVQGALGGWEAGKMDAEERRTSAEGQKMFNDAIGGGTVSALAGDAPAGPPVGGGKLPAFAADVTGGINAATAKYNLDPSYLPRTAQLESGGRNIANPNSSADGVFQFIDSTAKNYGLTNKRDPWAAADAAARLALDNKKTLVAALGREPTPAELYLAHQQGGGGAARLLANPDAPAASIVGEKAVRLNGGRPGMTAGEFANKWITKFGSPTQVASADPSFVPQPQGLMAYAAPQAPGGGALPSMAGGMPEPMQMPPQAAAQPPQQAMPPQQAPAPQQMAQAPQQAPQAPPDPTADAGNPIPPQAVQQAVQAASSPAVLQAAQTHAATPQGRQLVQQASGATVQNIMRAMAHPGITDGQRSVLAVILKQKIAEADPLHQAQLAEARRKAIDGPLETRAKELDIRTKTAAALRAERELEGEGAIPLTPEERVKYGIGPNQAASKTRSGEIKYGPAGTSVTIDQKGESTFEQGVGRAQAEMFTELAKDGATARNDVGQIRALRTQLAKLPGGLTTGILGLANSYGIKLGPQASTIEAVDAILNRLTPAQRQGMPGAASDRDVAMFKAALPKLSNTPDGNKVILDTMEALAVARQAQADVANKVMTGRLTRAQGMDALQALPDPFQSFRGAGGENLVSTDAKPTAPGGKSFEHLWR